MSYIWRSFLKFDASFGKYAPILLGVATTALVALCVENGRLHKEITNAEERVHHLSRHERQLVGGTALWAGSHGAMLDYNLRSFDDGKTWYSVKYDDDFRMTIEGEAETLYPGLVAIVHGVDALVDHASQHGQLDLSKSEDQQVLKDAGFDVKSN